MLIKTLLEAREADHPLRAQRIQLNLIGLRSFACRPGDRARVRVLAASIADEIVQLERVDLMRRRFDGEVTQ